MDQEDGTRKLAFLIILMIAGACALGWVYWPRAPRALSAEQLVDEALRAESQIAQSRATAQLSNQRATRELRQVMAQAKDAEVRATAAQALGDLEDFDSVPDLLRLCDDPSALVRGRAASAVTSIIGMDFFFQADDAPAKRAAAIVSMRKAYDRMRQRSPHNQRTPTP